MPASVFLPAVRTRRGSSMPCRAERCARALFVVAKARAACLRMQNRVTERAATSMRARAMLKARRAMPKSATATAQTVVEGSIVVIAGDSRESVAALVAAAMRRALPGVTAPAHAMPLCYRR